MIIATKNPITLNKDIIGTEEKVLNFQFSKPMYDGDNSRVQFIVYDGATVEDNGRRVFAGRSRMELVLTNTEFSKLVSGKSTHFDIYTPKLVELFLPLNSGLSVNDFEEK